MQQLEERLSKITDLAWISRVLSWDQQTMMPPAGSDHRADHLATLRRIAHELLIADETGALLDELRPLEESLEPDSDNAALIRLARRDYEKAVRVPTDLTAEMAHAAAQARPLWVKAKAESNFELFLPALERNVELRRRYVACFDGVEEPYDILLDDFEPYATTAEVREIFDELKAELVPLIAELRDSDVDDAFLQGNFPVERQERLAKEVVGLFGFRPDSWRLDPTEHPFASGAGVDDVRITTHYDPETMKSFFSTMHEYGHGLYSHQLPRKLQRLPIGNACSLGIHESQSRLWENLVGRSPQFWRFFYPRVQGMHIILRFEREQDIVNGRVELRDLPHVWNERMREYLGVDVPDDAHGVLQDTHWASGLIGYFATYLLGSVMSVQIWEKVLEDVPDLEDQIERGEFGALRQWLGEHVHAHGRKFSPQETLERATGSRIDAKP